MSFHPTYLYIKQHNITKKLYFGKSTRDHDGMIKYNGSGKYWKYHIKKHGQQHVVTLWYCLFLSEEDMIIFATCFSSQENIGNSDSWANLRAENGLDGFPVGVKHAPWSDARRAAQSARKKNLPSTKKGKTFDELYGKDRADELRKSHSAAITGKTQSAEARAKNSKSHKHPQKLATCPVCSKTGGASGIRRYHYDKCKFNSKDSSPK